MWGEFMRSWRGGVIVLAAAVLLGAPVLAFVMQDSRWMTGAVLAPISVSVGLAVDAYRGYR